MHIVRTIVLLFVSLLYLTAATGTPALNHFCSGLMQSEQREGCDVDQCCSDDEESTDEGEDACCEENVTVSTLDTDAVPTSGHQIPVAKVCDLFLPYTGSGSLDVVLSYDFFQHGQQYVDDIYAGPPAPTPDLLGVFLI